MRNRVLDYRGPGEWTVPDDAVAMRVSRTEIWTVEFVAAGDTALPARIRPAAAPTPLLIDGRPMPWRQRPRLLVPAAIVAASLAAASFAAWWALTPPPGKPGIQRVEIDLPPLPPAQPIAAPAPIPASAFQTEAKPKPVAPVAAPSRKEAEPERKPAAASEPVALDTLPEVQAALRRTVTTGAAEPWAAAGLTGFAVTSPIQIDADRACRNVAIWAEAEGAQGATINRRLCLTQGGAWAMMDD